MVNKNGKGVGGQSMDKRILISITIFPSCRPRDDAGHILDADMDSARIPFRPCARAAACPDESGYTRENSDIVQNIAQNFARDTVRDHHPEPASERIPTSTSEPTSEPPSEPTFARHELSGRATPTTLCQRQSSHQYSGKSPRRQRKPHEAPAISGFRGRSSGREPDRTGGRRHPCFGSPGACRA